MAIIGPSNGRMPNLDEAIRESKRLMLVKRLRPEYQEIAIKLQGMALGKEPIDVVSVAPIYVRQACAMQERGLKLTEEQ